MDRCTDVPARHRSDWGRLILMMMLSASVVAGIGVSLGGQVRAGPRFSALDNLTFFGMLFAIFAPVVARQLWLAHRAPAAAEPTGPADTDPPPAAEALRAAYQRLAWSSLQTATFGPAQTALRRLADHVARAGLTGHAFRLHATDRALAPPGPILDVPIEPTPLRERDPEFRLMFDVPDTGPAARMREGFDTAARMFGVSPRYRRWLIALGVVGWLLGIFWFLVILIPGLFRGLFPMELVLPLVIIAATLTAGLLSQRQWLLAPGALIVRTGRVGRSGWTVHLFRRDTSTLLYAREFNMLAIADENAAFARVVTPTEADAALRAWASNLPPPPQKLLAELQ